jgi:hypothetical protein
VLLVLFFLDVIYIETCMVMVLTLQSWEILVVLLRLFKLVMEKIKEVEEK